MMNLTRNSNDTIHDFAGKMLIAMPGQFETRFSRAVIYLCIHNEDQTMGFIVNRPSGIRLPALFKQLDVDCEHATPDYLVLDGGPIERDRGFVIHSNDYFFNDASFSLENGLALTATHDILKALSSKKPPKKSLMALGYTSWEPEQLKEEIYSNSWLVCEPNERLIFGENYDQKWNTALESIGVDPKKLLHYSGKA